MLCRDHIVCPVFFHGYLYGLWQSDNPTNISCLKLFFGFFLSIKQTGIHRMMVVRGSIYLCTTGWIKRIILLQCPQCMYCGLCRCGSTQTLRYSSFCSLCFSATWFSIDKYHHLLLFWNIKRKQYQMFQYCKWHQDKQLLEVFLELKKLK